MKSPKWPGFVWTSEHWILLCYAWLADAKGQNGTRYLSTSERQTI